MKSVLVTLAALAAVLLVPARASGQPVAAEPFLLIGVDAALASDRATARRFLGAAVEIDPSGSDGPYYLARVNVESDVPLAISLLSRAIANDRFERVPAASARLDLATLQVRVGKYREALTSLDGLKPADSLRVEAYRLAAAAWLGLDSREAALSSVEAGLARFPADAPLHVLRAQALRAGGFPVRSMLDLAALVAPKDQRVAVERALAALAEGGSPLADELMPAAPDARLSAEVFAASPDEASLDRFFAAGGNQRVDLLERVRDAARTPALAERILSRVAEFSGTRWVDENTDGIPEETYRYEKGALVSWSRDANQDGVSEVSLSRTTMRIGDTRYSFAPYPFLDEVGFARQGMDWTFELPPRRIRGPFLEGVTGAAAQRLRGPSGIPSDATLAQAARLVRASGTGAPARTWFLEAGVPTGFQEDDDGDGKADYVLAFRAGVPTKGQRDVDHDGIWDVVETWTAGGLQRLDVDMNHNGVADYIVDFARRTWVWDYDEDGRPERSAVASPTGPIPDWLWPSVIPRKGVGQ
jgi:hypothetical protein